MRKILALILSLIVVFSLATTAFAADGDYGPVRITKQYWKDNANTGATGAKADKVPVETLSFDIQPYTAGGYENPKNHAAGDADFATPYISLSETADSNTGNTISIDGTNTDTPLYIHYPEYKQVGRWFYTVQEKNGLNDGVKSQGADYDTQKYILEILVTHPETSGVVDFNSYKYQAVFSKAKDDGTYDGDTKTSGKSDSIDNEYKVNNLSVTKNVSGNLGSKTEKFNINVELTSTLPVNSDIVIGKTLLGDTNAVTLSKYNKDSENTATPDEGAVVDITQNWKNETGKYTAKITVRLAHGDTCLFEYLPDGVTYTVTEDVGHAAADDTGNNAATGYTITYKNGETPTSNSGKDPAFGTIGANASVAVVENEKSTNVATGVILDNAPYVLLLAVAAVGMILFFTKKRQAHED